MNGRGVVIPPNRNPERQDAFRKERGIPSAVTLIASCNDRGLRVTAGPDSVYDAVIPLEDGRKEKRFSYTYRDGDALTGYPERFYEVSPWEATWILCDVTWMTTRMRSRADNPRGEIVADVTAFPVVTLSDEDPTYGLVCAQYPMATALLSKEDCIPLKPMEELAYSSAKSDRELYNFLRDHPLVVTEDDLTTSTGGVTVGEPRASGMRECAEMMRHLATCDFGCAWELWLTLPGNRLSVTPVCFDTPVMRRGTYRLFCGKAGMTLSEEELSRLYRLLVIIATGHSMGTGVEFPRHIVSSTFTTADGYDALGEFAMEQYTLWQTYNSDSARSRFRREFNVSRPRWGESDWRRMNREASHLKRMEAVGIKVPTRRGNARFEWTDAYAERERRSIDAWHAVALKELEMRFGRSLAPPSDEGDSNGDV